MSSVTFSALSKRFGDFVAVDSLDLRIEDGEFCVFVGPSGCGKTTALPMLSGLEPPSGGRIQIGSRDITDTPARDRNIAMVFQNYALYPHMTVAENMGFALRMQGTDKAGIAERVRRAADLLEVSALLGRYPRQLSGGQRQRVAVGRAIVRDPEAFLFDEPLSNLDAKLRNVARTELKDLQRRLGTTTVYVTHDQVEAMTMADRIVIMNHGRVEQVGAPLELYDDPETIFVAGFLGSPPMNLVPVDRIAPSPDALSLHGLDALLNRVGNPDPAGVVLGFRPERAKLGTAESASAMKLRVRVALSEHLGAETVLVLDYGGARLAVRASERQRVQPGTEAMLSVALEDIILFDAASGRRIRGGEWT